MLVQQELFLVGCLSLKEREMRELNAHEIREVNGGLIGAFLVGVALGSLGKKLYNKYLA